MKFWVGECQKHGLTDHNVPMIMVGNKCEDGVTMAVNTNEAQRYFIIIIEYILFKAFKLPIIIWLFLEVLSCSM